MQMDGYFHARSEPVIKLDVGSMSIEVLVDTGFGGSLMIPSQIANRLGLKFEGPEEFETATGEVVLADACSVEIDWLGGTRRISVVTSPKVSEALLGGHMLNDCRLTIDYGHHTVTIVKS